MRVLYDYQAFMQRAGGVSRYFADLIGALNDIDGFEGVVPPFFSDNEFLESRMTFLTGHHFKGKERIMGAVNRMREGHELKQPFDVFHPTYYHPYFLPRLRRPFVVTVHDMIHELFSGEQVRDDGTARNKRKLCAGAAKIITASQRTKADLCSLLRIPETRVRVIPHATRLRYSGEPRLVRQPYLLYVGARDGYKNFATFLKAAGQVLSRDGVELVCVGGGIFTRTERDAMRTNGLSGRVHHFLAPASAHLASLYHFASLFCYPSLYEGFGIPLLEAFSCGCPVAASNTSSIPEVAGDAAELFEPGHADSIAAALDRVLSDSVHAACLVAKGSRRLRSFSWERSARQTLDVYREAS
jgi:glycosyltransferase involved in cell wall biosynthesis